MKETIAIVGDTHSDPTFVANCLKEVKIREVETVVQLGDFGYTFDRNMIASISAWLERSPANRWIWLDGNHDDHDMLGTMTEIHGYSDLISMGAWTHEKTAFHERIFYAPRSSTVILGESLCMFMGGAYSIDKAYRTKHVSWWPQELVTAGDIKRAEAVGKVDVVFSHDMPIVPEFEEMLNESGYKVGRESLDNRMALTSIVAATRPQDLYHGHYHFRHEGEHTTKSGWTVDIHGVGANVRNNYIDPTAVVEHNILFREL